MNTIISKIMMLNEQIKAFRKEEKGATFVEYAVVIALIVIVAAVGLGNLGTRLNTLFNNTGNAITQNAGTL